MHVFDDTVGSPCVKGKPGGFCVGVLFGLWPDQLEIKRLSMGVLIPATEFDFKGEKPKMLTTRIVRTWRDKALNGQRVWVRRSRYVAREFAWLSPDRQDLFTPASSVNLDC